MPMIRLNGAKSFNFEAHILLGLRDTKVALKLLCPLIIIELLYYTFDVFFNHFPEYKIKGHAKMPTSFLHHTMFNAF